MADFVSSQKTAFLVGHSIRGFEVSARKATLDLNEGKQVLVNEYQKVSHPVFLQTVREAYTLVNGKDKAGIVAGQRVEVQTTRRGRRFVEVDLLIVRIRLLQPKPGKKAVMLADFSPLFGREGA